MAAQPQPGFLYRARMRARPTGPAQSSFHYSARRGPTKEVHRRRSIRETDSYAAKRGGVTSTQEMTVPETGICCSPCYIASDLRCWELAGGLEPPTCCLQDSGQPSAECWRVVSLQLTSGASSSQCAPIGPSSAWWNDNENDMPSLIARLLPPSAVLIPTRPGTFPWCRWRPRTVRLVSVAGW
jgi:hypothetical protein